jgi:hypothetical protein
MGIEKQLELREFDRCMRRVFARTPSGDEQLFNRIWQRIQRHIGDLASLEPEHNVAPARKSPQQSEQILDHSRQPSRPVSTLKPQPPEGEEKWTRLREISCS